MDALLKQDESLRQESMHSTNNRMQTMVFGIAAIGALVGGSMTISDPAESKPVIYAIFSGAIPCVCVYLLLVWVSEAVRAHRVGYFLAADAEARINLKLRRLVLTWEASLWIGRLRRDELFGPSMMAVAMIGLLAVLAPLFGLIFTRTPFRPIGLPLLVLGVPYAVLLAAALYVFIFQMSRLRNHPVIRSVLAK